MKRQEIEDNLRDDVRFRQELVDDRNNFREAAKDRYQEALAQIDRDSKRAKEEYLAALTEADDRIRRADRAIARWQAMLAKLDQRSPLSED